MKDSNLGAPGGEDPGPSGLPTPEERYNRIAEAAYLRAATRGFVGGDSISELFVDMSAELPGDEALDGMKIDTEGNLYVTAPDGVRIYSPSGKHLGTITVPRVVHNLAWGGDGHTLYLCASDRLYRIDVLVPGTLP